MDKHTIQTCSCGHVIDSEGYCLIVDRRTGEVHRVGRWENTCIECGERAEEV